MKKRNSIIVSILAFALLIGGGALLGIFCKKPFEKAITSDDTTSYVKVDEIYSGNNAFSKTNFDKFLGYIQGSTSYDPLEGRERNAAEIRRDNYEHDIVVTFGGFDWTVTYISKDNNGNAIATLWLTNSSQIPDTPFEDYDYYGCTYRRSQWCYWGGIDPGYTYQPEEYALSMIRSLALNNPGYTLGDPDSYSNTSQSLDHPFAEFTMDYEGSLVNFIVQPRDVRWQITDGNSETQMNGDLTTQVKWDFIDYSGEHLHISPSEHYTDWGSDYLWLPSWSEVAEWGEVYSGGCWGTSLEQRREDGSGYISLRSSSTSCYGISTLSTDGNLYNSHQAGADTYFLVRPALHLNLTEAAKVARDPVWTDFAASKFANEDEADGSEEHPYEISSAEELARLAYVVNYGLSNSDVAPYSQLNYKQTADIQLGQYNWTPIGVVNSYKFMGSYDGGGYNIDGLYINGDEVVAQLSDNEKGIGLFGRSEGEIKNVTVRSGKITASQDNQYCYYGGIVGMAISSNIENCKSYVDIDAENNAGYAGGIVGQSSANIKNCVNYGNISAEFAGGIVGDDEGGTTSFCTNYGNVYGKAHAGGICGYYAATISNCTVYGEISGDGYVGGIVPYSDDGKDNFTITNCGVYATIIALGTGEERVGGFIGYVNNVDIYFRNCFFIGTIRNAAPVLAGYNANANLDSCYAIINGEKYYSDGDFSDWAISDKFNSGYPVQRDMYWSMQFAPEFDINYFDGWTKI